MQPVKSTICKLVQDNDAQNHDQQTDSDNDQQNKSEPAEHHCCGADARLDAAVAEVLRDGRSGDRSRVLPEHRDEDEDTGDEDQG